MAKKLTISTNYYLLMVDLLYKMGYSVPLLKCVSKEQAENIMKEVPEGICGCHIGGRSLVTKVLRAKYFGSSIRLDHTNYVKDVIRANNS